MKKLNIIVLLMLISSSAIAGYKATWGDAIVTDYSFQGYMGSTRNSDNSVSMISTFEQNSVAGFTVRDKNGVLKRCITYNPELIDKIRNMNNDAGILVYFRDGVCTSMLIYNHSGYAPKY